MSNGKARWLYNNLLTTSTITETSASVVTGLITSTLKNGTGSALMTPSGTFTGANDLEYTVIIDSVSGGTEIGQATFKWKDGGTVFDASGVLTAVTPITLNNGVTVAFTAGTGADFVLNDTWTFKGINRFSPSKTVDFDRDTRFKSVDAANPITIVYDMATAQSFDTFALIDHNLSAAATITLEANATDVWTSPSVSETITWNLEKILTYFTTTHMFRYVRLVITDVTNPDGFIQIGNVSLGQFMETSKTYITDHTRSPQVQIISATNIFGSNRRRFLNRRQTFNGTLSLANSADITKFSLMLDTITDKDTETIHPIYFNLDSASPNEFWLMEWDGYTDSITINKFDDVFREIPINLIEVGKTLS